MSIEKFLSWVRPKLSIMFEVTNACNLRCPFCYVLREHRMKNQFIPLDRFEKILNSYRPLLLHLTGGEVTLHPQFIELIKIASKYTLRTQIASNGLNIEKFIDSLIKLPKKPAFGIALDAPNELHDIIRGKKGLFRTILRTFLNLRKARIQHSLHVTVFGKNDLPFLPEGNLHLIDEMLSFCERFQLNANFQPFVPTQRETRIALGKKLLKSKSRYIINSIPYRKLLINGLSDTCRYNWTLISISARGYHLPTKIGNCYLCSDCSKCFFNCAWEPSLLTSIHFPRIILGLVKTALSVKLSERIN